MRIGLYNRWLATLGGGERYMLTLAESLSQQHEVTVISHELVPLPLIQARLGLDLRHVRFSTVPAQPAEQLGPMTAAYDLFINGSNWDFIPNRAPRSALVVYFPLPPGNPLTSRLRYQVGRWLRSRALQSLYPLLFERWFKGVGARLQNLIPPNFLDYVQTYDQVWAISQFTQRWVQSYWHCPSQLLYPPVNVAGFQPLPKRKQILHVGRFFAGNHNKKHSVMVAAFKTLVDQGLADWELHLAGGVNVGAIHDEYLRLVQAEAGQYPIHLHTDLAWPALVKLYGESAIYWHASGYGEDEALEPMKFEHFGITTVEAMASGCVPVVIGKGGQPELIQPGVDGFLWHNVSEMLDYTRRLTADEPLCQSMATAAVESSRRFDLVHFQTRVATALSQLGIDFAASSF